MSCRRKDPALGLITLAHLLSILWLHLTNCIIVCRTSIALMTFTSTLSLLLLLTFQTIKDRAIKLSYAIITQLTKALLRHTLSSPSSSDRLSSSRTGSSFFRLRSQTNLVRGLWFILVPTHRSLRLPTLVLPVSTGRGRKGLGSRSRRHLLGRLRRTDGLEDELNEIIKFP